ncbi:MAG: hypothetical protein MI748_01105 [Opitutales bacterium]|nr:hypothetical protein [Opitutales bacterium]
MKFILALFSLLSVISGESASENHFESEYEVITIAESEEKQIWFGYYDKWQVDTTGRYALGCKVELFFRSPTREDVLKIGLIDLEADNSWTKIGESRAWSWQQGCMLQWIPGSSEEVIWNDVNDDGAFVSRVYNIRTQSLRTLPKAVYTLSPNGEFGLCLDFDRLQFYRPGYGYPAEEKPEFRVKAPTDKGIYRMDLKTGECELILSISDIAGIHRPQGSVSEYYHWFNHLLINESGNRFFFLNRSRPWAAESEMMSYLESVESPHDRFRGYWVTRAITANLDGNDVYVLNDSGRFSHFIWKADKVITAWGAAENNEHPGFFEFLDKTKYSLLLDPQNMPDNGHNTYVPNTNYEWILNDTYPDANDRKQTLYLYHVPSKRKVVLGRFYQPEIFTGEWRCDLHPRCDQQGSRVFFDSTHEGHRKMYMIDISKIISS